MRVVHHELKYGIAAGMQNATSRLVDVPNSPLLMGGTVGLVYFIDGPEAGFNFVSDFAPSPDYGESGFPKELWMAFADYLENIAQNIREGKLDRFCQPRQGPLTFNLNTPDDVDGSA